MSISLAAVSLVHANGRQALDALDLSIAAGERVAIIGPSGAGKTTLLRMLATGIQSGAGQFQVLDCDPWAQSARARRALRARIGLIHQAPPLPQRQRVVTAVAAGRLGHWSLGKSLLNLIYPLDIDGVHQALSRLDLGERLFDRCDRLSGGQLQRVSIARVLYQQAELVLADEPVSAMDPVLAGHVLEVLNADAATRRTTLIASLHAVELALAHFPRIVGLRDGKIAFDCPTDQVTPADLNALYRNVQLGPPAPSVTGGALAPARIVRC